tara:strand:- start:374 stop:556 length:183 start_codon:yes stop_codon:yes gene_type:complete
MKTYDIIIDQVDSFICPIKAESQEEALEKAKSVVPFEHNVPHSSESKVIGVWGEPYTDDD